MKFQTPTKRAVPSSAFSLSPWIRVASPFSTFKSPAEADFGFSSSTPCIILVRWVTTRKQKRPGWNSEPRGSGSRSRCIDLAGVISHLRLSNRLTYVHRTSHQRVSLVGLAHHPEQVLVVGLLHIEDFYHSASEVFHGIACRAATEVLVRAMQSAQQQSWFLSIQLSSVWTTHRECILCWLRYLFFSF